MSGSFSWFNLLTVLATAFAVSVLLTPMVRGIATRYRMGDKPNGRRAHIRMIPHLGGVAIVAGVLVPLALWGDFSAASAASVVDGVLVGAVPAIAIIVLLGLIDDVKSLRAMHKLVVQIVAAAILVGAGFVLHVDGTAAVSVGALVLSFIFFIGMPSAVNVIDGHDGLAGGMVLISALAFALIANAIGFGLIVTASLSLVGACLGFLVFNFPPGTIYMGDTGSMFLGTMLALVACSLSMFAPSLHVFFAVCLVLGIPALDAILAIVRRVILRSPVFLADSLHMHHVLQQAGFSPRQVLAILLPVQLLLCALGVAAAFGVTLALIVGALVLATAFIWFLRQMVAARYVGGRLSPDISSGSIPLRGDRAVELSAHHRSVGR